MQEELQKTIVGIFEEKYGIPYSKIVPLRGTFFLVLPTKRVVAQKIEIGTDKLLFVNEYKNHIFSKGFTNIDSYLPDDEGNVFFQVNEETWVFSVLPTLPESNFDNKEQIGQICQTIAKMHLASEGFEAKNELARARDELGKMPEGLQKRLDELKRLRRKAEKGRGLFDLTFLPKCSHFIELGSEAVKIIKGEEYSRIVEKARTEGSICHCDLSYQSILADGKDVHIANFESCAKELKIYDLANLIRRKMRKCNWDFVEAEYMLEKYDSKNSLSKDDLVVLKALMIFPQKFWRIANKYYNMKRGWAEKSMDQKLQEAIAEMDVHYKFVKEFEKLVT